MKATPLELLGRFEKFLLSIPIEEYRQHLQSVKTVEQDLPRSLNPLPAIYEHYWAEQVQDFPDYEQFFDNWWQNHLQSIDEFVRKYFWGCSWDFIRLGFKARLYRTAVSVLTQFHFCYAWKAYCETPLYANWELDLAGIDAEVIVDEIRVALQIKKETYRAEAGEGGRFARRRHEYPVVIEIPYTLTRLDEWLRRCQRARREAKREEAQLFHFCASKLQRWLDNGFVVFQPEYPKSIEALIRQNLSKQSLGYQDWRAVLRELRDKLV